MTDPNLVPGTRERIGRRDHIAIFAHGECFRFALRLHERWGYRIRGMLSASDSNGWGHVWAIKEGKLGIDIRGIYPECILAALANKGKARKAHDVDPRELRALIEKREYPADLTKELDELADWVIESHERFKYAKPEDKEAIASFAADLAKEVTTQ